MLDRGRAHPQWSAFASIRCLAFCVCGCLTRIGKGHGVLRPALDLKRVILAGEQKVLLVRLVVWLKIKVRLTIFGPKRKPLLAEAFS